MENKYLKENIVKAVLFIFAFISVITTAAIVASLFLESVPFFNGELCTSCCSGNKDDSGVFMPVCHSSGLGKCDISE